MFLVLNLKIHCQSKGHFKIYHKITRMKTVWCLFKYHIYHQWSPKDITETDHTYVDICFMTKVALVSSGKLFIQQILLGQMRSHMEKKEFDLYLTTHTKINSNIDHKSKWEKQINKTSGRCSIWIFLWL